MDKEKQNKQSKNTGMAIVAYILFFIPLLTEARNDPFVKYHVKQGLCLFLTVIAGIILSIILTLIPIIGFLLVWLINIFLLFLLVIGVLNAIQGKEKELPLIGKFAGKIKI